MVFNKKMRMIEAYFFTLSFMPHIFYLKNQNTYKNNKIFNLFLGEIFNKSVVIYKIDFNKLDIAAKEFYLHYNDRKNIYIAAFMSDLCKYETIYSETIHEFMLHLYGEVDSDEFRKIIIPIALQFTLLTTECMDCL